MGGTSAPGRRPRPRAPEPTERKICGTRILKTRRHRAEEGAAARPLSVRARVAAPLFSGTVHFLAIQFRTPSGVVGVSTADTSVAVRYCTTIAPIASRYASQYGPNSVAVDPGTASTTVTPSQGTTYTDAELAGWVDAYAATAALPAGDAVAVLNPPAGVENTDAKSSEGVLGYHSISPKGHPYLFVNVQGAGFTPDDPASYFALALSHELQELAVDPRADGSNPEVCDPCAGNCSATTTLELFDPSAKYLGSVTTSATAPPAGTRYAFYQNSMVRPDHATDCPAPPAACAYPPP
jgi:hypothetical protein